MWFFFYIFASDKDDFFSSGNVTIHAWLIKEGRNARGTHPDGGGEGWAYFRSLGYFIVFGPSCESQDRNLRQKSMNVWAENCLGHNAEDVCVHSLSVGSGCPVCRDSVVTPACSFKFL